MERGPWIQNEGALQSLKSLFSGQALMVTETSTLEHLQGSAPPGKARSLDNTPCKTSGVRSPESPEQSAETQFPAAATPSMTVSWELLPSEQSTPQDTKKDKAQKRTQQGWMKSLLSFLRLSPEEPKEKADRTKGKEGLPQATDIPEASGQLAYKKKSHDKKASRKKHSYRKPVAEEITVVQDQEAEGQEAGLSKVAVDQGSKEEANQGPAGRGGDDSHLYQPCHNQCQGAGVSEVAPQGSGHPSEEMSRNTDREAIILTIVELIKKVADYCEKENGRGAAEVSNVDSRHPQRPTFLPLPVGCHQHLTTSGSGTEESKIQAARATDGGGQSPLESPPGPGGQEPEEDRVSESKDAIIQIIVEFLKNIGDKYEKEGLPVPPPEVAAPNPASSSKKKKISFKRGFSFKRHGPDDLRKVAAAGAASPEPRPPKRSSIRSLCMGGQRSSFSITSDPEPMVPEPQASLPAEGARAGASEATPQPGSCKAEAGPPADGAQEQIFQKLAAILQEVGEQLRDQIRRNPGLKKYFREILDASLEKLVSNLQSQEASSKKPDRSLERRCPVPGGLMHTFADNNSRNVISLRDFTGHYPRQHGWGQVPYREAEQNITTPEIQSPD
ncbi:PREDICTED: uncharacterized protein C6orf222 homolog [Condylura cristata]|uniref:uncharacterized protein C6orf222 homolog n=1 Tax=Condylura cristata TaxID=143302 RepID=UPI0003343243|nr:PREDICTED: uncharacterized protein C6orf222 homolog [Condylura cristata]